HAVAAGGSTAELIEQVSARLTELLSLRSCEFQYGKAGLGRPARLQKDGRVVTERRTWDVAEGLPDDTDLELLVEYGGVLQGRFLMRPRPQAHPTLEQRLVAIALADPGGAPRCGAPPVDVGLPQGAGHGQSPVPERPGAQTMPRRPGQGGRRNSEDRAPRTGHAVAAHPAVPGPGQSAVPSCPYDQQVTVTVGH